MGGLVTRFIVELTVTSISTGGVIWIIWIVESGLARQTHGGISGSLAGGAGRVTFWNKVKVQGQKI